MRLQSIGLLPLRQSQTKNEGTLESPLFLRVVTGGNPLKLDFPACPVAPDWSALVDYPVT